MATKQSTKQPTYQTVSTYLDPPLKRRFAAHCRREHRTMAGELRLLIERRLEEAA